MYAALALWIFGVVALWPQDERLNATGPALVLTASGDAELWNSKAGESIFGAWRWRPGQRIGGIVRIENRSDHPVTVRLFAAGFEEQGASLSVRTRIRVQRLGVHLRPEQRRIVYGGWLRGLDGARIARLEPGRSRRYRVRVRLMPRVGDKYQAARLSFDLRWRALPR